MKDEYKESLALLAARPEFKALLRLLEVEENNIIIRAFKVNSSDPQIAIKKAFNEGEIYELRKIRRTFDDAVKAAKKND